MEISPIRKMMMARLVAVKAEKKVLEEKIAEKEREIEEILTYFSAVKIKDDDVID